MNSKWNGRTKGSTGGFRIRKNRLFSTKEAAEKSKKDTASSGGHHGPFGH